MSAPTHSALRKIRDLKESSSDYPRDLDNLLHESEYEQCVAGLGENDQRWLVDFFDTILSDLETSHAASRKCLRELKTCCRIYQILPGSYEDLFHQVTVDDRATYGGGFSDIYKGYLDGKLVCVKRLRKSTQRDPESVIRDSYGHAAIWKHLKHRNILPLHNISTSAGQPLDFVSPWIDGGTLGDYLQVHSDANRLNLILDVAEGLDYLHSRAVIHGDLKGPNILVDTEVRPCARLADFDVTTVTENPNSRRVYTRQDSRTAPWASPEVLKEGVPSRAADVYSFAMVMIEVCIKGTPFGGKTEFAIGSEVVNGERHERPEDALCTDALWLLIVDCWSQNPQCRPETSKVLERLACVREIGVVQS